MYTPEQQAAITATGNVLLMAGAGTGKTSTLVGRVLDRATRTPEPVPLDRILMVTFTEAAAAEMRHRLRAELGKLVEAQPECDWLASQLARLETAPIGTIHGFCLRLVRDHFHALELDPQLRVLDPPETRALFQQTLGSLLDPLLGGDLPLNRSVQAMISQLLGGDLAQAGAEVRRVHDYARSRHDGAAWLAAEAAKWSQAEPDVWRAELEAHLPAWARAWQQRLAPLVESNPKAAECRAALSPLCASGPVADLRALAAEVVEAVLAANSDAAWKMLGVGAKTRFREGVRDLFDDAAFLQGLVRVEPGRGDPLVEDWRAVRGHMTALIEVVQRFAVAFARAKRELGVLDFADLEQFALRLLGDGTTPVAAGCRERFECVFVDEAQDLNPAQDAILRAVGRPGDRGNRFLVGDVKQSIYRFRLSDPRIFQEYARVWGRNAAEPQAGRVLPLTGNFRSHGQILQFVNAVFPALLCPEVGGVVYDESSALRPGAQDERPHVACDGQPRVEIHLRLTTRKGVGEGEESAGDTDAEAEDSTEAEARLIARRLTELRASGLRVWDRAKAASRPMEWRDAVVLLRAPGPRGGGFARVFTGLGIPLATPPGPFFDQSELRDLVSLLQILDNPLQDIPLAAVLRSPLAGVHDVNQLALIRMAVRREHFWTALQHFRDVGARTLKPGKLGAEESQAELDTRTETEPASAEPASAAPRLSGAEVFRHPDTTAHARAAWPRVDRFLRGYAHWRRLAQRGSMETLLETILDETGYEEVLRTLPDSPQRLANVQRLLDVARRFDSAQRGGLLRFLGYLETQREAGVEAPAAASGDAVSLMSIHASKGLEFPVVAVAGMGNRFNLGDLRADIVLDEEYGLCPVVVSPDGGRYPSWPLWRAVPRQRREALGEELRLLYVALTRACDRLLLVGTALDSTAAKWEPAPEQVPVLVVAKASSPLHWLGPVFRRLTGAGPWAPELRGRNALVEWQTWGSAIDSPSGALDSTAAGTGQDTGVPAPARSSKPYLHAPATREAAKQSVTALRRRAAEAEDEAAGRFRGADGVFRLTRPVDGPARLELTPAERGTLHHLFQEHVALARTGSKAELVTELERLQRAGRFTEAEAAALDLEALTRFWTSALGDQLRSAADGVRREVPFTLRLTPAELRQLGLPHQPGLAEDEFIVAQGVIDIAVFWPDGTLWIGDFKTDQVTPESLAAKAASYAPQLALYSMALARIYRRKVTRRWLHFLALGDTVDLSA